MDAYIAETAVRRMEEKKIVQSQKSTVQAAAFQVEVAVCCFPTAGRVKKVGDETSPLLPACSLEADSPHRLCGVLECYGAVRMTDQTVSRL